MFPQTSLVLLATLSLFSGVAVSQSCEQQSCDIADASGSTGRVFDGAKIPTLEDVTDDGRRCIESNYVKLNLPVPKNYKPISQLPAGYTGRTDWYTRRKLQRSMDKAYSFSKAEELEARQDTEDTEDTEDSMDLEKRQTTTCMPKMLIWARGTIDPPVGDNIGLILGPNMVQGLQSKQPGQWGATGIEYSADFAGIFCLGMPGSVSCTNKINQIGAQCPQTKFIVAGYSQGAMIAHGCTAFANDSVRDRIAGVVVFGDPFNGAPIRHYPSANIKTFCDPSDGVCGGKLNIGLGHFSYSAGDAVTQAINWIVTKI